MRTSRFGAVLALLLACLLLFSCAADTPSGPAEGTDTTLPPETEPVEYFRLTDAVCVTRPTGALSDEMLAAVQCFNDAGKGLTGGLVVSDDWYRDEMVRREFEILLGATNRPESVEALAELSYYDYMYEVVSPNVVVVCGGCDETTLLAAERFLADCYGFTAETSGTLKDIPVGTSYVYRHAYAMQNLQLCGKPIGGYTIVHAAGSSARAGAEALRSEISKLCGINLPLLEAAAYTGGDAFFLGMAETDGSHLDLNYGKYGYATQAQKRGADSIVVIDTTASVEGAARAFAAEKLSIRPNADVLSVNVEEEICYAYTCTDEMNGLVLLEQTEQTIADGVVYRQRKYVDQTGAPVIAYVLEADLQKIRVLNGTPNFGERVSNVKANTRDAMIAAVGAGHRVYAGVNANFFHIDSDYSPTGLCIKSGVQLNGVGSRPWFGITTDGQPVIGTSAEYTKYAGKIFEGFGGGSLILRDGTMYDIDYGESMGYTRHPRTAVGIGADGKLLLVVVDGRQPRISNGASLGDLAAIFLELGATDALNLDGGGSSTMVTSAEAGKYVVHNSPSDGDLRSVYNSLLIAAKP